LQLDDSGQCGRGSHFINSSSSGNATWPHRGLDLVAVPAPARHVQQLIEQTVVASDRSGSHWALSRATDENEMVLAPTAA